MAQKRIDVILDIIKEKGYVTVKYLCEQLHYSTATINRDLNELQRQELIKRSHGGAGFIEKKYAPLVFRIHENREVKTKLAGAVSQLIEDNMTLFIDGSTTAQFLGKHIIEHKNMRVITNNLNLASFLSEAGVTVVCLGGKIIEAPYIIGGTDTVQHAMSYNADLAFFSTCSFKDDGRILCGEINYTLYKVLMKNSKKSVFMADSSKLDYKITRMLCDFSSVSVVVSDYVFSDKIKNMFPETEFIEIEK